MKSKFLIIVFLSFFFSQSYANEKDTLLVYLVESDSALSVDLVFENMYNDSVLIPMRLENLFFKDRMTFGISVITYLNKKEFRLRDYPEILIDERFIKLSDKIFHLLPPEEKIIYHIDIRHYFGLRTITDKDETGAKVYLNFPYTIKTTKQDSNILPVIMEITTNYIKVNK